MNIDDYYAEVASLPLNALLKKYPHGMDFLANLRLDHLDRTLVFRDALTPEIMEELEDFGLEADDISDNFVQFLSSFAEHDSTSDTITSLTILGGQNKSGDPESSTLTIRPGEIISIVGPTGSGKSRLLEDIEALAQRDTPTKRQILLNGSVPTEEQRFSLGGRLVAQLSQNMNFVMDITVISFLVMHAKSRLIPQPEDAAEKCFSAANALAGEKFSRDTKVTQLSGGQSRALMISDTALMSSSPIILIDEIENAGIDRKKALELLSGGDKIILMSTHDPLLALNGTKRVVISNGGIAAVLETTAEERESLSMLEEIDAVIENARNALRYGKRIDTTMMMKKQTE